MASSSLCNAYSIPDYIAHICSLKAHCGETLLKAAKKCTFRVLARRTEEAKKMLGYVVAKNFLGFLCAHQNDT